MALFLLQSSDDSAAAANLILHAGDMVDDLVRAVQDLDAFRCELPVSRPELRNARRRRPASRR